MLYLWNFPGCVKDTTWMIKRGFFGNSLFSPQQLQSVVIFVQVGVFTVKAIHSYHTSYKVKKHFMDHFDEHSTVVMEMARTRDVDDKFEQWLRDYFEPCPFI